MKGKTLYEQLLGIEIVAGPEFFLSMGRVYLAFLVKSEAGYSAPLIPIEDRWFHFWVHDIGQTAEGCAQSLRKSGGTTGEKWAELLEGLNDETTD